MSDDPNYRVPDAMRKAATRLDEAFATDGASIQVGVPEIRALVPAAAVRSRLVTTKNGQDQSRFETEIRRQRTVAGVSFVDAERR